MAYRLELPSDARVHPVVHVSQLKQHVAPTVQVQFDLSDLTVDPNLVVSPVAFTDSRLVLRGASMINQVRVQWNAAEHPLMTWEELNDLKRCFPKTPAWGQPDFRGGGNVRHRRKACGDRRGRRTGGCVRRQVSTISLCLGVSRLDSLLRSH